MILVKVERTKNGKIKTFLNGHSGYAKAGRDIVCAAVSALAQGAVIGLTKVLNEDVSVERSDGCLQFEVADNLKTEIVVNTMVEAIKDLAKQYPKNIKMEEL